MASSLKTGLVHYWPMTEAAGNPRVDVIGGKNLLEVGGTVPTRSGPFSLLAPDPAGSGGHYLAVSGITDIVAGDFTIAFMLYLPGTGAYTDVSAFNLLVSGVMKMEAHFFGTAMQFAHTASGSGFQGTGTSLRDQDVTGHPGWYPVVVTHDLAAKNLVFYCPAIIGVESNFTYTGTLVSATDLRVGEDAVPCCNLLIATRKWTPDEIVAYLRGRNSQPYSQFDANDGVGIDTVAQAALNNNTLNVTTVGQGFQDMGAATFTSNTFVPVSHFIAGGRVIFVNGQAAPNTGEIGGVDGTNGGRIQINKATLFRGYGAPIALKFGGLDSITLAYGEVAISDEIAVPLYPTHQRNVLGNFIRAYFTLLDSKTKIPNTGCGAGATGVGYATGDHTADTDNSAFSTSSPVSVTQVWGGSMIIGRRAIDPAFANNSIVVRGDSIEESTSTYMHQLVVGTGGPQDALELARSGEAALVVAATNGDTIRAQLTKIATTISDGYGENDLRDGSNGLSVFKTAKQTMWRRWFGTGSNVTKFLMHTLLPIAEDPVGFPARYAAVTTNRAAVNGWMRTCTSAELSTMMGRPVQIYDINLTTGVRTARGSRGVAIGTWLDVYLMDSAYFVENDTTANGGGGDNVWSAITTGGKLDAHLANFSPPPYLGGNGDGIHPQNSTPSVADAMPAKLQTAYNAFIGFAAPAGSSGPPFPILFANRHLSGVRDLMGV